MLSRNLEQTLHRALALATERRHEYATLEHLLLALVEDQDAVPVFRACGVDVDRLRQDVVEFVDTELDSLKSGAGADPKPTAGFQRVVQRSVIHVQSSGREEVTGANVMVALFSERRVARRVFPPVARNDPAGRRQLHFTRHRQGAGRGPPAHGAWRRGGRGFGEDFEQGPRGAGILLRRSQAQGPGGADRPADRP